MGWETDIACLKFQLGFIVHPSNFIESDRPTDDQVEAAARELHRWGELHGWWPPTVTSYDALDAIGKEEFDAIVERVLMSAAAAKRGVPPTANEIE